MADTTNDHHLRNDYPTAAKDYFNDTFATAHVDIGENWRRWFAARTSADASRALQELVDGVHGREVS